MYGQENAYANSGDAAVGRRCHAAKPSPESIQKIPEFLDVYIFHGTLGHSEENWFPYLKKELEARGHKVTVPNFPTPQGQTLENWMAELERHSPKFGKNTVLIGHSIGAALILHILSKLDSPVRAAYLVAGFLKPLGMPEYDPMFETFIQEPLPMRKIKRNAGLLTLFQSEDDPYVSMELGKHLAKKLGTALTIVPGAGHFNEKAGYVKFEQLLHDITGRVEAGAGDAPSEKFLALMPWI